MEWRILAIVLLVGVFVFLWGTAYKVSLYKASRMYDKVPVAKLSTLTSETSKADVAAAIDHEVDAAFTAMVLAVFLLIIPRARLRRDCVDGPAVHPSPPFTPEQFLRPPPAFSFLSA